MAAQQVFGSVFSRLKNSMGKLSGQRIAALFLLLGFVASSVAIPPATVLAAVQDEHNAKVAEQRAAAANNPHIKQVDPDKANKPMPQNYPEAAPVVESKNEPAADYTTTKPTVIPGVNASSAVPAATGSGLQPPVEDTKPKTFKEEELLDKRTADSTTHRNKDGSYTVKQFTSPKFYKKDNAWRTIDTSLIEDKNAGDSGNLLGKMFGQAKSWFSPATSFTVKENDWQARFLPSDDKAGMVRIKASGSQISFTPVGAQAGVTPQVITDKEGRQTIRYTGLWPGVDVEYEVRSAELKENIILKNKQATTDFSFSITGAKLKKSKASDKGLLYDIEGALGDDFSLAPLSISLNKYGFEAEQPLTQSFKDGRLHIGVDRDYLTALPDDAYPVTIDPTTVRRSGMGNRSGGNYLSFKSDGSVCYSHQCNPYAGAVLDSNYIWRNWRGAFFMDYEFVKGRQLTNARLHLEQRLGLPNSTGDTGIRNITAWHAGCLGYECRGMQGNTIAMGTVGDIDVTGIYQNRINANDWGAWLMLTGEEIAATTYKNIDSDPDHTFVEFTFVDILPSPGITSTVDKQVYIDPQVSFSSTTATLPNGTPLHYNFCVSSSPNCGGAVMISSPQTAPLWTIPDGLLQDGNTYYVQVQSYDPSNQTYSSWGVPVSFKIDSRSGKDSTQAYDTLGPVSADLATGNVTTSAASHSSSALGGSLGVSLDYNSPVKSRNGLVGEYWSVSSGYDFNNGAPSSAPNMTRVDQTPSFNWDAGSPDSTVTSDWFYARWTGYFTAPTTGAYYFGGRNDDTMSVKVNNQQVYLNGGCYSGVCYGSSITLQAGQTVPIAINYLEATSTAYIRPYVKGPVGEQIIRSEWLNTGVRPVTQRNGLIGQYYKDNDTTDTIREFNGNSTMLMQRTDPTVSFDWNSQSAIPGGPSDNFLIRWTGYITAPVSGTYEFGTFSDDGSKVTIGNNDTVLINKWNDDAGTQVWSSGYNLTAGQPTRITVDFYEHGGAARMYFQVRSTGAGIPAQVVPTAWLSSTPPVLPAGWNLGLDPDGNISYDHLRVTQNSVILTDSTGSTHEYQWDAAKNGYKPPVNEDGHLIRNADATFTFQDSDGRTYVFNANGTVQSVTNAVDDLKPAAIQYTYSGTPSRLTQITDGVDSSRWAKVYYYGDSTGCPSSIPSGFDSPGPSGMLCAVTTNDGRSTSFFYKNGNLARIQEPGNEITDYQYDTLGRIVGVRDTLATDAVVAGVRADDATTWTELTYDDVGRAKTVIQPAPTTGASRQSYSYEYQTERAILSRFLSDVDHTASTQTSVPGYRLQHQYGSIYFTQVAGTVPIYNCKTGVDEFVSLQSNCEGSTVLGLIGYIYSTTSQPTDIPTMPLYRCYSTQSFIAATANCDGFTQTALLGYMVDPRVGTSSTASHITGSTEPNGFTRRIEYDRLLRTTKDTDIANLSDTTVWDAAKDMVLSTTDEAGLTSTTIYDDEDRAVSQYGPAPAAWFGSDRKPLSAYTAQVPRTDTAYDEGMQGPAVAYYNYATNSQVLAGAPKLHSTNLTGGTVTGDIGRNWGTTTPVTGSNNWGFRATGRIRLPATGQYLFRIASDNGVRLYIDDRLQLDDWNDGQYRDHPQVGYENTAGSVHRFRLEYYHRSDHPVNGNMAANITMYMTPPGGSESATNINQYLSPDYSLTTSSKVYDGTLGDSTTTTNYGANPELGLAQSTSVDPTGLNLTTTSTYETQGATGSFLRQTSKSLPGNPSNNPSFTYTYYGATETRDDPCTTTVEAYRQGGMMKIKTEADPDGAGSQTGRTTETIYDDAGKVVATRYNTENWTCTSYDSRSRTAQTHVQEYNGAPDRTITNNYAVGGNPLQTATYDENGWVITTVDLLGRTVNYTDTYGDWTGYEYMATGELSRKFGDMGEELFYYDNYRRLSQHLFDGVTYATVTYDSVGRIDYIDYNNAGQMRLTMGRDNLGRTNTMTYRMGDGTTTVVDTVTRTQANQIVAESVTSGSATVNSSFTYDGADRLTGATVGSNTYSYGFGTQDSSCGTSSNMNTNSGKNSNRTTQTINGVTSTFCYDFADRLVSSSNAIYNSPAYDSRGNMTSIGTGNTPLNLCYDSSDRNSCLTQFDSNGDGVAMYYGRDAQDRITYREKDNVTGWNWNLAGQWFYSYTGMGDTPDFVRDTNWNVIEKTIQLPGGVNLTVKPQEPATNDKKQYSLPNIHGDTLLTANAAGTNTSNSSGPLNSFVYDPFGTAVPGSVLPANTASGSYGWVGQHEKLSESSLALAPIQMGARVYLPGIGRFASVDAVEGGTENNYVYPADAVNEWDLTGTRSQRGPQRGNGPAVSQTQRELIRRYQAGLRMTQKEAKEAKRLIRTKIKTAAKMAKERASRATKDLIKKGDSFSKKVWILIIPSYLKDGINGRQREVA